MCLGGAMIDMKEVGKNVHLHPDRVLLKEPGLYSFLLRCKRDEAEPFMEWVVETVLSREVRKLASTMKEKDAVISLMNDDLQDPGNQIQAIKYENVALQAQEMCIEKSCMTWEYLPSLTMRKNKNFYDLNKILKKLMPVRLV